MNEPSSGRRAMIAVVGNDEWSLDAAWKERLYPLCGRLGRRLAERGCIILTGGDGGVGRRVLEAAKAIGCVTIAFYPGYDDLLGPELIDIPIRTGVGVGMRDNLMIRSADGVVAIGGGCGTLNEITLSYSLRRPVVALEGSGGWAGQLGGRFLDSREKIRIESAATPEEAVDLVLALVEGAAG